MIRLKMSLIAGFCLTLVLLDVVAALNRKGCQARDETAAIRLHTNLAMFTLGLSLTLMFLAMLPSAQALHHDLRECDGAPLPRGESCYLNPDPRPPAAAIPPGHT